MDHRIHQLQNHPLQFPKTKPHVRSEPSIDFKDVLKEAANLKVSKHAKDRLAERNIDIAPVQWERISQKMNEAKQKGITNSLVVLNDATLVVSTKNNTVVTAMDRQEATSHIFTNINGTILMNE